ncbi:glycerol-3-phosphate dehydrogenase [Roseospira goensis]|uniref:Glycerol-3-phosphate dehydrogenase n=1 Tax=Roseospira goensis TaxID=391922 RepID=A0A7W6RWV4_9PROT|nr:glycerol-3-phosphate dehydrogenase [Roseospira goensis]MBB4284546.1 glycerol-3-phosphate dehydrogenase [Roseospira goensis]
MPPETAPISTAGPTAGPSTPARPDGSATAPFDLAIVGGGINGCGIARDAAGRGLSVFLCDKGDLAGGTSSASTKLIHGGLRYLEYYEFRLVREALKEREVLLRAAPHIIWPLRFVLPHHRGLRPFWLLRLGLFLYDHLGGRRLLPGTTVLDLHNDPRGASLRDDYVRAFEYSDCWVEDSRLVTVNALDAVEHGAVVRPRTRCVSAERAGGLWRVTLRPADDDGGRPETVHARTLVNAAGPWVTTVLSEAVRANSVERVRLVKGSHIVTRKLYDHDRCYIFQNSDGRIMFAIPYERDFTLIGTTDLDFEGDPTDVAIDEAEVSYLMTEAAEYLRTPIRREDVCWTYAGVRPLYDDGAGQAQQATRDYVLTTDGDGRERPLLLSVFGGKITTYRRLAEAALEKLRPALPFMGPAWTRERALPGGNFPVDGFETLVAQLRWAYPFLESAHARRLARLYGTRARELLGTARSRRDLGRPFGADLYEREVDYLMRREFARTADDVLWRRTKLGLRLSAAEAADLAAWMADNGARMAPPAA